MSINIPSDREYTTGYIKGYAKCENITTLLRTIIDFSDSFTEIIDNKSYFSHHINTPDYMQDGPLRECLTAHLVHDQHAIINIGTKFSKTLLLLDELTKIIEPNSNKIVTKAYVTCLPPKKRIYLHSDTHVSYWNNINRYQFYYTGDNKMIQTIDNTVFSIRPGYFYHFDHRQLHSYKNNSSDDLILMVFDLLK
jgi:hypothetical protein